MPGTVAGFCLSQRPTAPLCGGPEAGGAFFSFPLFDLVVKPLSLMLQRTEEKGKLNLKKRIITKRYYKKPYRVLRD